MIKINKVKRNIGLLALTLAFAIFCTTAFIMMATLFITAKAENPAVDANGWYVGTNVNQSYGFTDVDGYSAFLLDHGGKTINENELDLTKEFSFAFRVKAASSASHSTFLHFATPASVTNWSNMSTSDAPLKLKVQNSRISPEAGFIDIGDNYAWTSNTSSTHYLTVYIGTGALEDTSYVIIDGVKKESTVVRSDYETSKAKLFMVSTNSRGWEISGPNSPVITSMSKVSLDLTSGQPEALSLTYINATDNNFNLTALQYDTSVYTFNSETDFTIAPSGSGKGTITLSAAAISAVDWPARNAYIAVANASGAYKVNLTVKSGVAPMFVSGSAPEFKLSYGQVSADVTVDFTYVDIDAPKLYRGLAPVDFTSGSRVQVADDNAKFTFNRINNDSYRLTLKTAYLNGDETEAGTYWFEIDTKNGNLEFPVYIAPNNAWATRTAKGTITQSAFGENYSHFSMHGWENGNIATAGRAFYSEPLDVTKPIFIEYGNYTEGGWILFDLNDNPYGIEYCDEVNARTPGKIKILDMVANLSEQARWGGSVGFVTNSVVGVGNFLNKYNMNVIEIGIGVTSESSYIKINGNDLTSRFTVSVKQSDFENGEAYLSIFTATQTEFDMNKNVNAVAVIYSDGEPDYNLKTDNDLTFTVKNRGADFAVAYRGHTLVKDTDYTLNGDILTIKGSYMKTIPFTTMITFVLSGHGTATEVNIPASMGGDSSVASLVNGESAIKYYTGAELSYSFDLKGETFINVIDADTENEISVSLYSYANGALTLKTALMQDREKGVHKLMLQTENSLVPFYVLHFGFADGYAVLNGLNATGNATNGFNVSGGGELVLSSLYDLNKSIEFDLTLKEVIGYYETGSASGNTDSYVAFTFYDIENGNTVIFRVRPNANDDNAFIRNKLWGEITVVDSLGRVVYSQGTALRLSVFETHKLVMSLSEDTLSFKIGDEPAITIALGDFDLAGTNLLLTVVTVDSDVVGKEMQYALKQYIKETTAEPNPATGCKSQIGAFTALSISLFSIFAAVIIKKRGAKNYE